uniref:GGDEF domain-containing protein n=1 Tax=uncultured Desulfobacterium sp. TaxID=201089 RepID=E1YMX1_9BACT|nr:hypothetical protein N47_O13340 [uncultured Desulfobacterium sp.]
MGKVESMLIRLAHTRRPSLCLSFDDVLTGLYNHTYFEEELLRHEYGRQFPLSGVTVKIDNLLEVNKRDGIAAGNDLLRRTAKLMKMLNRNTYSARISGDKFAILLRTAEKSIGENAIIRLKYTKVSARPSRLAVPISSSLLPRRQALQPRGRTTSTSRHTPPSRLS